MSCHISAHTNISYYTKTRELLTPNNFWPAQMLMTMLCRGNYYWSACSKGTRTNNWPCRVTTADVWRESILNGKFWSGFPFLQRSVISQPRYKFVESRKMKDEIRRISTFLKGVTPHGLSGCSGSPLMASQPAGSEWTRTWIYPRKKFHERSKKVIVRPLG